MEELRELLKDTPSVVSIRLCEVNLDDELAVAFAEMIIELGEHFQVFIKALELPANNIGDKGALALLAIPFLEHLNLAGNGVTDEGADKILKDKALRDRVTFLDLRHNEINPIRMYELVSTFQYTFSNSGPSP